jgi:nitrate reductase delta subunit
MTSESEKFFDALAGLLEYPCADWPARFDECKRLHDTEGGESASAFADFARGVAGLEVAELQELYTRTFDLNPVCALEVGYHLFGDTYKRGLFLARLRETEESYELGQERQLPDFLPVMLRLVARLEDAELRGALVADCLMPAALKMTGALERGASPYAGLVRAVASVLSREAGADAEECCAETFEAATFEAATI